MLILIAIILLVFYIIDYQKKLEKFKNNMTYQSKFLNDPDQLIQYKNKRSSSIKSSDTFDSADSIQSNQINPKTNKPRCLNNTIVYVDPKQNPLPNNLISNIRVGSTDKNKDTKPNKYIKPNDTIIRKSEFNPISTGSIHRPTKTNLTKTNLTKTNNVKFNPITSNMEKKYKLYGSEFIIPEPSGKIKYDKPYGSFILKPDTNDLKQPIYPDQIDQSININISNYVNHNIQSNEIDYQTNPNTKPEPIIGSNIKSNKNRTIKEIYDNITNDNRLALQQNLDDLEAWSDRNDYIIGEKYGATRFDTYSVR